ncbi:cobalt-precorrin-6A reductase [Pseudonocardia charpentierae]|uniref:Cobalt-precorrin-6A reductase n=1 Tax=Pseudonocardia charpentierae TaxID=3075545 RepID=A0ABU2N4R8_9PSEU|nr:cobalt-precorrin-6A reductase [Pseudonocardia sp. DSM 45834]MDT0348907.1 cobalt-precorrin-6A reductase [Pseudonocardia sp. DSM 45834]
MPELSGLPGPVLILGGTAEARALAAALVDAGVHVVSSLAGRVRGPALPVGEVRIGGFGGVEGLAAWLREHGVAAVVDATHPFASTMTAHAVSASATAGVPLVVLRRPGWPPEPGWVWAESTAAAATLLPSWGKRVFLTTGRTSLAAFVDLDLEFLVRCVDPPTGPMPRRVHVLLSRGPFTVDGERSLMREHGVDVLVTKDSGGPLTSAKLAAAREEGVTVLVVRRPPLPAGVEAVDTVEAAVARLRAG